MNTSIKKNTLDIEKGINKFLENYFDKVETIINLISNNKTIINISY